MKATLVKENNFYYLVKNNKIIAEINGHPLKSITGKLSKQNCNEIFGVVDVEKLASEVYEDDWDDKGRNLGRTLQYAFEEGFNKAMELNGDKQFTLEDMKRAISFGQGMELWKEEEQIATFIQSRQQPIEIEVEIDMKKVVDETKVVGAVKGVKGSGDKITTYKSVPKLNAEGCLILKKVR